MAFRVDLLAFRFEEDGWCPPIAFGVRIAGPGTEGHPRLAEQEEMGQELAIDLE